MLFNVHRYFLKKESPVFADMFSLQSSEGSSDSNPILLEGTTPFELETFLACIYPRCATNLSAISHASSQRCPSRLGKVDELPSESWISVLKFATKWQCDAVRDIAMEHLQDIRKDAPTLAQQIALAKMLHLDAWYQQACLKMCERSSPLTEAEAELLDKREIVRISAMRHFVRASALDGWPDDIHLSDVDLCSAEKQLGAFASGSRPTRNGTDLSGRRKAEDPRRRLSGWRPRRTTLAADMGLGAPSADADAWGPTGAWGSRAGGWGSGGWGS